MKLLLVFAFCGVTCCLAEPTCSLSQCVKVGGFEPGVPITEEILLNRQCREIECYLEVHERCGTVGTSFPFPAKGYQRLIDGLCDVSNPLRKTYIENAGCIRGATRPDKWDRLTKMCGIKFTARDEYCRKLPEGFGCMQDYVTRECGKDATEAFKIAALPGLDPYDCFSP